MNGREKLMEMYRKKGRETGDWSDFDAFIAGLTVDVVDRLAKEKS